MTTDWTSLERDFALYLDGDPSAARTLFQGILPALQGFFRARLGRGPDAEDLVQTTVLKIHFARDRYDPKQALKTWVFTIASRSLIDHWRGLSTENDVLSTSEEEESLAQIGSRDLDPELKTQLHGDLNRALETLKPIDRSIVYLYGVEGMSMAEIARSLSLTEGATKLRAHRAYVELRKKLAEP